MAGDGVIECPKCLVAVNALRACLNRKAQLYDVILSDYAMEGVRRRQATQQREDETLSDELKELFDLRGVTLPEAFVEIIKIAVFDPDPTSNNPGFPLALWLQTNFGGCEAFFRDAVARGCVRRQPGARRGRCLQREGE